jgi:phosphopantothenoylcysteine synthetase/decarboxylase
VGFAAETEQLLKHAEEKVKKKKLDLLVANHVGRPGRGFESDDNAATLLWPGRPSESLPLQTKAALAWRVAQEQAGLLGRQ